VRIVAGGEIGRGVAGFSGAERVGLSGGVLAVIGGNFADVSTCDDTLPVFMTLG
jgi:hypothetical protein